MNLPPAIGPTCSLDVRAFQDRVKAIAEFNARALQTQERTANTLVLTYAPGNAAEVADLVAQEGDCCGFLDFSTQEGTAGVVLTIAVPADQAERADELLAPFDGTAAQSESSCCGAC
ncbi:hypothetical protein [Frateuria sp. Soil773]|uniref:hypothetical protein n=1 Tax=Frateuria sp. Soil773 TaxID=1736407 RepID=UPI0012F97009|nr:hypothetical protein [Frateuria sp. Soil773]